MRSLQQRARRPSQDRQPTPASAAVIGLFESVTPESLRAEEKLAFRVSSALGVVLASVFLDILLTKQQIIQFIRTAFSFRIISTTTTYIQLRLVLLSFLLLLSLFANPLRPHFRIG